MQITIREFTIPLKEVFRVSRESYAGQDCLIVELEQDGIRGYGEATAFSVYGASIENMRLALRQCESRLQSYRLTSAEQMWEDFSDLLSDNPFAQCAMDVAAHDWIGKKVNKPLHQLWGLDPRKAPPSNYSIGIGKISTLVEKVREKRNWPIFKIKLGGEKDLEVIRELRKHTGAVFRVDANAGWTVDETLQKAPVLKELGVEFIEQPLARENWPGMEELYRKCALPVVADESCTSPESLENCKGRFHGVNLKLMKCGGITPARRMISRARELGLSVMLGCMPESSIGASAIAQLAPLLDCIDVDCIALIAKDLAKGIQLVDGRIVYTTLPGCGFAVEF